MSKRLRIFCLGLLAAAGIGVTWYLLRSARSEPIIDGQPLSTWLSYYTARLPPAQILEADRAVEKAGTNAIPTLLRMLRQTDSPLKVQFMKLAQKQHFVHIHYTPAVFHNYNANCAFRVLGPRASAAVPDLIAIYERNPSPESCKCAADALAHLGPAANAAIPALVRGLATTNRVVQCNTLRALAQLDPERVLSPLTNALSNPDPVVRNFACQAFITLAQRPDVLDGPSPTSTWSTPAVQTLVRPLSDSDTGVRTEAAMALETLLSLSHPQPNLLVPALTNALTDTNFLVREFACQTLLALVHHPDIIKAKTPNGEWVSQAYPALQRALKDPVPEIKRQAAATLQQLDSINVPGAVLVH